MNGLPKVNISDYFKPTVTIDDKLKNCPSRKVVGHDNYCIVDTGSCPYLNVNRFVLKEIHPMKVEYGCDYK